MTGWRALIPYRPSGKSRLAAVLSPRQRAELAEQLVRHVLDTVAASNFFSEIELLTSERPGWWHGAFQRDGGSGLNAEIARWRNLAGDKPCLIIHGDLPLLQTEDLAELCKAASNAGIAIAPDRHMTGTNAIALKEFTPLDFLFGEGSFAAHVAQHQNATIVRSPGLALDIDLPEDLVEARLVVK